MLITTTITMKPAALASSCETKTVRAVRHHFIYSVRFIVFEHAVGYAVRCYRN